MILILIVLIILIHLKFNPSIDRFVINIDAETSVRTFQYILWYTPLCNKFKRDNIKLFKL